MFTFVPRPQMLARLKLEAFDKVITLDVRCEQYASVLSCDIPVVLDNMMVQGSTVEHN